MDETWHDVRSRWPAQLHTPWGEEWIDDLMGVLCPADRPWTRGRSETYERRLVDVWTDYLATLKEDGADALRATLGRLEGRHEAASRALERCEMPPERMHDARQTHRSRALRIAVLEQLLDFRDIHRTPDFCGVPELHRDADDPLASAPAVFDGRSRADGAKTHVSEDVRAWAVDAFWHLRGNDHGAEEAKDEALRVAESHDYHFTRRSLEDWID